MRGGLRTTVCGVIVMIAAAQAGVGTAMAQRKPTAQPCEASADPELRAAATRMRVAFDALTLTLGVEQFVAFTTAAVKASPFALPQQSAMPPADALQGVAWFRRAACTLNANAATATLRLVAGAVRFHEAASGWSAPQTGGTLAELHAQKAGVSWTFLTPDDANTMFLPGARLMRPTESGLPERDRWPASGCDTMQAWDGDRCVGRRSGLAR